MWGGFIIEPFSWRRMWPAMQAVCAMGTLEVFIHLNQTPHAVTGHARRVLLAEAVPGALVMAWWTFWACRLVWRGIRWLRSRAAL